MAIDLGSYLWPDAGLGRQPQTALGLDESNSGAQTITSLLPLGVDNRDVVTGKPVKIGTGGSITTDQRGLSLKGTGTGGRGSIALDLSSYSKLTLSFWMLWDAYANDGAIAMEFTADGISNAGIFISPNHSSGYFEVAVGPISTYGAINFPRPTAAVWHHFQITIDRNQVYAGLQLWVDGVAIAPAQSFGQTPGGNFANSSLYLLSRADTSAFSLGRLQNIAIRGGYLGTAADALAEYRNPFQAFSGSLAMPVLTAGGGSATVIPIGVSATGSVGTPTVTVAALATPAGVSATASVGAPTATGGSSIPATALPAGVSATANVGTPSATGTANAMPAGVGASAAVGTPAAFGGTSIPATALPAGVAALSYVGTPIATGAAKALPAGVQAASAVGTPVASAGVSGAATVQPSGVQALSYTGTAIATGAARAYPAGTSAVGAIGLPIAYAGVFEAYIPGAMAGRRMAADSTRPARMAADSTRPARVQTGSRPAR